MKKIKAFLKVFFLVVLLLLVGCSKEEDTPVESAFRTIYDLGVDAGTITVSFDDWLETVVGVEALPGIDGKEVVFEVSEGYIKWKYDGDTIWNNLIEIASLTEDLIGMSAYEIYLEDHPEYVGDEETWISDLISGNLDETKFTVSFVSNCDVSYDDLVNISRGETIALPSPTKTGFTFMGWYLADSINSEKFYASSEVNSDLVLYGMWSANQNIIRLNSNNGLNLLFDISVDSLEEVELPANTYTKEGYNFVGWSTTSSGSVEYTDLDTISTTTELFNLYAIWEAKNITISFESNGGNGIFSIIQAADSVVSAPTPPVKIDFIFEGWYSDVERTIPFVFTTMPKNDLTLYADWSSVGLVYQNINNDQELSISDMTINRANVEVPTMHEGKLVTAIGLYAFRDLPALVEVSLPNTIKSVSSYVFDNTGIYNNAINNSIIYVDGWAVATKGLISSAVIEEGTVGIARYAFVSQVLLKSVVMPNSVRYMNESAFYDCVELEHVSLSDQLTFIDGYVFSGCEKLNNIDIPSGITSIGSAAFVDCKSLTEIVLPDSVINMGNSVFQNCEKLESFISPRNLESMGYYTFYGCLMLKYVVLSTKLTVIPNFCFYGCDSLISIQIPSNVTIIEHDAFNNCDNLALVVMPNILEDIGLNAFKNCLVLDSIMIPETVKNIGQDAFYNTKLVNDFAGPGAFYVDNWIIAYKGAITSLIIEPNTVGIAHAVFMNASTLESVSFPVGFKYLGAYAFLNCDSLTLISLPGEIEVIDEGVFYECDSLDNVVIPNSVKKIGKFAFSNCDSLSSIQLSSNLEEIGEHAFIYTSNLENITLPASLKKIGSHAFYQTAIYNNASVNSVVYVGDWMVEIKGAVPNLVVRAGTLGLADRVARASGILSVTLPSSLLYIGDEAFFDCFDITTIILPSNLISIGNEAFVSCISLDAIIIPDSVEFVGEYAFSSLDSEFVINCEAESQPIGWDESWNPDDINVVWGYNG